MDVPAGDRPPVGRRGVFDRRPLRRGDERLAVRAAAGWSSTATSSTATASRGWRRAARSPGWRSSRHRGRWSFRRDATGQLLDVLGARRARSDRPARRAAVRDRRGAAAAVGQRAARAAPASRRAARGVRQLRLRRHLSRRAGLRARVVPIADRRLLIRRDLAFEQAARHGCRSSGSGGSGTTMFCARPPAIPALPRHFAQRRARARRARWRVEAEGTVVPIAPSRCGRRCVSGIDWFELHGAVDFGGTARLACPRLLAALRHGESTVTLDDGTTGLLPEEWLAALRASPAGRASEQGSRALQAVAGGAARRAARGAAGRGQVDERFAPRARGAARVRRHRAARRSPTASSASCATTSAKGSAGSHFLRALRLRRLPRRRHGPRQDRAGAGAARSATQRRTGRCAATVAGRRPALARLQLEGGGGALRAGAARARAYRRGRAQAIADGASTGTTSCSRPTARCGATCHAAARTSSSTTSSSTRRRPSRTRRPQRRRPRGCCAADHRLALTRHADREPSRRAVEPVRVPEPGHARQRCGRSRRSADRARDATPRRTALLARALRPFILRRTKAAGGAASCPPKPSRRMLLRAGAGRSASSTTSCASTTATRCSARIETRGPRQVEDARARGAAAAAPGGLPSRPDRPATRRRAVSAKLDVLLPQLDEVRRGGPQGAGLLAVHEPARPSCARGSTTTASPTSTSTADARPRRRACDALPERSGLRPVPDQPEGRRPRAEPDRGRLRVPARSVVEPGGRGAGDRPRAPHRPDPARVRLPADRQGHGRGEDARAPGEQARPGRRHPRTPTTA